MLITDFPGAALGWSRCWMDISNCNNILNLSHDRSLWGMTENNGHVILRIIVGNFKYYEEKQFGA